MLQIDVITIFPALFDAFLDASFVGLARKRDLMQVRVHDLRTWTTDRHRSVDDSPYGGGPGMLLKPEPLVAAIDAVAGPKGPDRRAQVVLLSPQGMRLDQAGMSEFSDRDHLVLVCGRYEGVDQRVIDLAVDLEVSIGDYVLSGGEIPAMVLIEGISRLIPGVLGNPESAEKDSHGGDLLEGPQYTRPPIFRGLAVPEVLLSGDHAAIERWRCERARERTEVRRPDLIGASGPSDARPSALAKTGMTAGSETESDPETDRKDER